ncbi:hypothetical protein GC173_01570 [bacterium]|nr:hypothetical protein [bacterium]
MATFESFFHSTVQPYIGAGRYAVAITDIEEFFPQLGSDFDRSEAFHWLASLHAILGSKALTGGDVESARSHFGDVQEFAIKALDLFANRPDTLVFLARFCLSPMGQPERAFPLLEPFEEGHRIDAPALLFYDHVRLVLRGVVLALIGSTEEAFEDWRAAYSRRFMDLAPERLDTASLFFVGVMGTSLPEAELNGLLATLAELGVDSERIESLRTRLA